MLNPPLVLPNVFVNGTIADANQVDANFNALLASINQNTRVVLAGNIVFYVAPGGTDAPGNGLSPSSPCATHNYVRSVVAANYDLNQTYGVTVQLANGTYNESMVVNGTLTGQQTPGQWTVQGNMASPNLVTVVGDPAFFAGSGALALLQGFTRTSSISDCIIAQNNSTVWVNNCVDGPAVNALWTGGRNGRVVATGNTTFAGGALNAVRAVEQGEIFLVEQPMNYTAPPFGVPTINLVGTPNFASGFASSRNLGFCFIQAAFVGTATGPYWRIGNNGVINIFGQSTSTYLPGNSAGVNEGTGGQIN